MFEFTQDYRGWASGERFFEVGDIASRDQLVNVAYLVDMGIVVDVDAPEPMDEPELDGDGNFELPDGALDVQDAYDLESTGEIVFLTDEQILDVHGVGPATLEGLREWYPYEEEEGE